MHDHRIFVLFRYWCWENKDSNQKSDEFELGEFKLWSEQQSSFIDIKIDYFVAYFAYRKHFYSTLCRHTKKFVYFQKNGWKSVFAVHAFEDGTLLHQPKSDQDWIKAPVLQKRYFMVKWQLSFLKDIHIDFILEPFVLGKK